MKCLQLETILYKKAVIPVPVALLDSRKLSIDISLE